MYEIRFDPEAIEFLQKLPKGIAERIWNKVMSAKENPRHFFERLAGRADYKLRIGDYRAIADIDDKSRKIEVTVIGHRKNVYKDLQQ
ncbi:type II toxin-antitoxin system RelE/ParE family toxin [Candidatus Woesearchaeota archaeon]|nr:type II toxin-antitoxin system RelE/ParE family toxin [Candidatus Woesearchaeota archaeon]